MARQWAVVARRSSRNLGAGRGGRQGPGWRLSYLHAEMRTPDMSPAMS